MTGHKKKPEVLTAEEQAIWIDVYKAAIPKECAGSSDSNGAWWKIEYAKNAADAAVIALRDRSAVA